MYYPDRKRHNKKWKIIIPLFTLLSIISIFIYFNYFKNNEVEIENSYAICDYTNQETRELFTSENANYLIEDYFFYGQTLNLFNSKYVMNEDDDLYGKTVNLKNLCDGQNYVFIIDSKVDLKIPLENLDIGFYQLSVNEGNEFKNLIYNQNINEVFYTITKDNSNHKITLSNNKNRFDDFPNENFLKENYLFLEVTDESAPDDYLDLVIDPEFLELTMNGVDYGSSVNNTTQAEVNLKVSKELKEILEEKGLRVGLTRDSEPTPSYGNNSRLEYSYDNHAKYYLLLSNKFANDSKYHGYQIYYSAHASSQLATTISKELEDSQLLTPSNAFSSNGVKSSGLVDGFDGLKMIRESGGKALAAGTFSEQSAENSYFNENNPYGAQAIRIDLGYLSNEEDFDALTKNTSDIARYIANGFLKYLEID